MTLSKAQRLTDSDKLCHLARTVIATEAQMIQRLIERIDHHFAEACYYLHDCEGRIIVMGVGKSGHIGKKIAATFASTGSPSFFIHPSEARHGDIGMITTKDSLLVLSNSGETEEIISIIPFIKRLSIPLVVLSGNLSSTLAKAATIALNVGVEKEACPLGLAPTSSTTAALVMGDALAMALLEHRGFTEKDFALSHPGGRLGRRLLLKINELMHKHEEVPIISHQASLKEALVEMTRKKLGMTTVVDDQGQLLGVFTDGDVRRAFDNNADIQQTLIKNVMSNHPKVATPDMLAADALDILENFKITSLVVVDPLNRPIGVIHIHDILRAGVA